AVEAPRRGRAGRPLVSRRPRGAQSQPGRRTLDISAHHAQGRAPAARVVAGAQRGAEERGAGPARGARVAFDQTHAGDRAESSMNAPLEPASELPDDLGDFTATRRTLVISALAIGIGAVG